MRTWHRAAAIAAALLATGSITGAVAQADTTPSTLYVSRAATCSDSGNGSQATPFCTVQAAANIVEPGQTVLLESVYQYNESVTLTRSGEPGKPITFTSTAPGGGEYPQRPTLWPTTRTTPAALALSGVHDVRISSLGVYYGDQDGINVIGSHDITLDFLTLTKAYTSPVSSIMIDGASSRITVSRSMITNYSADSVQVRPGASDITVTTNRTGAIHLSGVTSSAVTGNTVVTYCGSGVQIEGESTSQITVENNVFNEVRPPVSATPCPEGSGLTVASESIQQVQADYNALLAVSPSTEYSWGGTIYKTAAAFAAATGQGLHDIDMTSTYPPWEGSPLIDSADSGAPGELVTDLYGNPRVDDLVMPNTGIGYADRGAVEWQYQIAVAQTVAPSSTPGIVPSTVSVTAFPSHTATGWFEHVTFSFDFGDGSAPVVNTTGIASHAYTKSGVFKEVTKATADTDGSTASASQAIIVGTATPSAAGIGTGAAYWDAPGSAWDKSIMMAGAEFTLSSSAPWEVADRVVDFGDGTTADIGTAATSSHSYARSGTYAVGLVQTDLFGRTSTAKTTTVVGDGFLPLSTSQRRVYDSRNTGKQVPSHGVVKLSLRDLVGDASGLDRAAAAMTVTVTVTRPKMGGYISVYPDGTAAGAVSNVNFGAGQTIANEVNAIPGSNGIVDFYNGSGGPVDLIVDSSGLQTNSLPADTYVPVSPVRVLDTRNGTGASKGAVGAKDRVAFQAAGKNGVPANADAVVLNVAVTNTRAGGYFTAYSGVAWSYTSNGNWAGGQTISNLAVVPLNDGKVVLYNGSAGASDFVADLVGYYNKYGTASVFVPSSPARLLDTRKGTGTGGRVAKLAPGQTLKLPVPGVGTSSLRPSAAAINLTVTNASMGGYLTAYPDGQSRGGTSSLNFGDGQVVANMAIVPVGPDNAIAIYNGSGRAVDVVVDEFGSYYSYPK